MSSNKTIIPGMENTSNSDSKNVSLRNSNRFQDNSSGTVFPSGAVSRPTPNNKPIVGFLYSISKSLTGEYWPLRIGSNSIGRSSQCDVCLSEATVSEEHAVLVVRQMKNPEKIIASICDARSTCGTMINGESLGFEQRECFNGDIITIGEHYDLYFVLIDSKQLGLNVCNSFMSVQSAPEFTKTGSNIANVYTPPTATGTQFTQGYKDESGSVQNSGTVGIDEKENTPSSIPNGTIFM